MKTIFCSLLIVLISTGAFAQNKDSLWTTSPSPRFEIAWQTVAPDGTLITATNDLAPGATSGSDVFTSLTGIDPTTGSVKWKYPAAGKSGPRFSTIDFIANTPFFKIPTGPLTIIDPYDGRVIIDLAKENITEEGYGYLLQSGHLWVTGMFKGDRCFSLFDLNTGKKLWSNAELLRENNKVAAKLGKLGALTGSNVPNKEPIRLLGTPINHGNDKLIVATSNGVFDLQMADGKQNWQAELPDANKGKMIKVETDINFMRLIPGPDKFYVVKAAYMTACSYSDGKQVWANPVKTTDPINRIIYDEKGLILCPGSSNVKGMVATGLLKMVDAKTGAELWGDGIKFNGGAIKTYAYTDKGLAVVMSNPETDKNTINFVDVANGKFILPKDVNLTGDVQYIELVPKGLLYKTDRTINILDLSTDASLFSFPVQAKKDRPIVSVNAGDKFYFYSDEDKNVYEIDKVAGTGKQLSKAKIEFQGGEIPTFIEVRKEGVALYAEQNVTLINFDGSVKFNVFHPGVRTFSTTMANVSNALDAMNVVMDVANAGTQLSTALNGSTSGRAQYDQANQAFASVGNAAYVLSLKQIGSIRMRLKASAQSQEHVVMMTRVDSRPTLIAVSKDTGATGTNIPLARKDDQPMYLIDTISGTLFYAPKGKNFIGWGNTPNVVSAFHISQH